MIDPGYLAALQKAFLDLHKCHAHWSETVPVRETFNGQVVWEGDVEVFVLPDHPSAVKGYAWAYDKGSGSEIVTVLRLPPVFSPQTAVQASIVGKVREQARN